jgi:preprotein translocase subunit SecG
VTIFLTVLHVMSCIVLVVVVLLQRGKGAEIGAVFGGGASSTVFGSRGAGNFLTKLTSGCAIVFMLTSLSLSYLATNRASRSLFETESAPAAPVEPGTAAPEGAATPEAAGEPGPAGFVEVPAAPPAEKEPPAAEAEKPAGEAPPKAN